MKTVLLHVDVPGQQVSTPRMRGRSSVGGRIIPPQQVKVLVYPKADPMTAEPGSTPEVTGLGHGTGDLEVQVHAERDLERAQALC